MNFSEISKDLGEKTLRTVNYILGLKVSDVEKKRILRELFNNIGYPFFNKIFSDASELFDSEAIETLGFQDNSQISRLSSKLVQNHNLGRMTNGAIIQAFYDSALGTAMQEAFDNAVSLDKHPTLTRSLRGETCSWCRSRTGTFVNPTPDLYARHDNCDCLFITSGYNSRNGILKNYTKGTKESNRAKIDEIDSIFKDVNPGVGTVRREGNLQIPKRKEHEKTTLQWLKRKVGGEYTILNESRKKGISMPDGIRNNSEIIEVKKVSTINGISDGIRSAIKQTSNSNLSRTNIANYRDMKKIVVLDGRGNKDIENMSYDEAWSIIERRIVRSVHDGHDVSLNYVVIRRSNGDMVYEI